MTIWYMDRKRKRKSKKRKKEKKKKNGGICDSVLLRLLLVVLFVHPVQDSILNVTWSPQSKTDINAIDMYTV